MFKLVEPIVEIKMMNESEGGIGHERSSLIFPNYRLLVLYDFLLIFLLHNFLFYLFEVIV